MRAPCGMGIALAEKLQIQSVKAKAGTSKVAFNFVTVNTLAEQRFAAWRTGLFLVRIA
jgi:hypothetical protein